MIPASRVTVAAALTIASGMTAAGQTITPTWIQTGHAGDVASVSFDVDGSRLASASFDGSIKIHDVASGAVIRAWDAGEGTRAVVFSPNGRQLASGGRQTGIVLWDAETGQRLREFGTRNEGLWDLAFSPDGTALVTVDRALAGAGQAIVWDVATGQPRVTIKGSRNHVYAAAFSPDGRLLATGGDDRKVKLWDSTTGKRIRDLDGHQYEVRSVAFSSNGRWIASASADSTVKLWDAQAGKLIRNHRVHERSVQVLSVGFSPDGKELIAGSAVNVKRWDVASGSEVGGLQEPYPRHSVWRVGYSADGRAIVTAGDRVIKLWDAATGALTRVWVPPPLWKVGVRSVASSEEMPVGYLGSNAKPGQRYLLVEIDLQHARASPQGLSTIGSVRLRPTAGEPLYLADVIWADKQRVAETVAQVIAVATSDPSMAGSGNLKGDFAGFTFEFTFTGTTRSGSISIAPSTPVRVTLVFCVPAGFATEAATIAFLPDEPPIPLVAR